MYIFVNSIAMHYVRRSQVLAVVETDEGWCLLFDGGYSVPNLTLRQSQAIIDDVTLWRNADGSPVIRPNVATCLREVSPA